MTQPLRVVIADDVALLRSGLARLLSDDSMEVVGEAGDVDELYAVVDDTEPDVVVTDIRMPPTHTLEGLDAAVVIRQRHPRMGILILSHHVETQNALELVRATTGGVGYLLKDRVARPAAFVEAVREVAAGGTAIDPHIVEVLLGRRRRVDPLERLSGRERSVLAAMAAGRSNSGIAAELHIGAKTVETHVTHIFQKLDLAEEFDQHRRVVAVLTYLRAGSGTGSTPPR